MNADISELVVTKGVAVVRKLAHQFAANNDLGFNEDDFVSLGQSTLVEIAPGFAEVKNVRFTTYIFPYVKGAMLDAMRRKRHEITFQGLIGQEIERETRHFSSRQSDEFEVLFEPTETIQAHLDATLSELAIGHAMRAAASVIRLMAQGSEDHLGEIQEHARATQTITHIVATLPPRLQRLWEIHYVEDRSLKEYMNELGISDATAVRDHKALRAALQEALTGQGIHGLPDVD